MPKTLFFIVCLLRKAKCPGGPDGMKTDAKGYIYATAPGGIWVFNPSGKVIARIYTGTADFELFFGSETQYVVYDLRFFGDAGKIETALS